MYQYDTGDFIGSRGNLWNIDWNNNYKLNKYISVTVALNLVNSDKHSSQIGISDLANLSPYEMLLNDDGSYAQNFHSSYNSDVLSQFNWSGFTYNNMNYNLLQEARHRRERISNTQMRTQLGLEFRIIDGLKFNSKFQYESSRYTRKDVNDEESFYTRYAVNYYTSGDGQGKFSAPPPYLLAQLSSMAKVAVTAHSSEMTSPSTKSWLRSMPSRRWWAMK